MGINLKYGKNSSAAKVMTTMPGSSTPPSGGGQRSGQVKHSRSGSSKVENVSGMPKNGAAH
jgi:hypothetical protein